MSGPVIEKLKSNTNNRSKLKLDSLLEITQAINSNFSAGDLFKIFEFVLAEQLNINKFAYCAHHNNWEWVLKHGVNNEIGKIQPAYDLEGIRDLTFTANALSNNLKEFQVVIPVFHKKNALAYLLIGGMDEDTLEEVRENDLEFIQTIANIIAVAIENKRLFKENVQQELIRRELDLAREMQAMLFPAGLPNDHQLEFAAYYQPHHQVGGDYYDFIRLNNEEVLFCVADVSGKGVSAALLMSNFQANLRALASAEKTLSALVGELNLKVLQSAKGEKFITFFVARYNTKNRNLDYINAGHNPPLLTSKNGIEVLQKGCPGLGILDKLSSVTTGSVQVEPGSFLLCYTDGLVEQENEGGKDFGLEQLTKFLETEQALSAAEFNSHLVKYLSAFKGVKPFVDDIALLSCRFF